MKAVPGTLPTLLEMIYFFSTPTIDVEPEKFRQKQQKFAEISAHEKSSDFRRYHFPWPSVIFPAK